MDPPWNEVVSGSSATRTLPTQSATRANDRNIVRSVGSRQTKTNPARMPRWASASSSSRGPVNDPRTEATSRADTRNVRPFPTNTARAPSQATSRPPNPGPAR